MYPCLLQCFPVGSIVQVVSLPNLQIVDVGYGFTGSTHDATAWMKTHIAQNHEDILAEGEFIFADSAYPVRASVEICLHLFTG